MQLKTKVKKRDNEKFMIDILRNVSHLLSDKQYLKLKYYQRMKKKLNLNNPVTFTEKLQWLKLFDRRPEYTIMVDKYEVKKYVSSVLGEEYIVPTLGVWTSFDKIDFPKLPDQFVLKCTHDSGGVVICKDKYKLDMEIVRKKMTSRVSKNYFWYGREWPYKNVTPRILAEKYMANKSGDELKDYKIFCFNGEPRIVLVCTDRFTDEGLRENFYDLKWNLLNIQRPKHPNTAYSISKPESLDAMLSLARTLSKNIPFVRVDFYDINGRIYFGEMTFFPASGLEGFIPEEWDYKLGEWIKLPNKI